jgi:PAS domain S-box-containing protein
MFIGTPEKARVDGQWTYYAAIRLLDGRGHFRGVLAAAVSIDHFESFYQRIGVDFGSRVQLLNEEGYLLAGRPHDENAIGKQVAPATIRARLRDKPPGLVVETEEATPEGPLFAAYRNVAGYPLTISVAVKEDDALATWQRIAQPIVIGSGGGVLFILAATLVIARNLLRRAALEAALKESDERLRHMVQSVQDAIVIIDSARHVVTFNRSAERLFGILAAEAVGSRISDLLTRQLDIPQRRTLLRHFEEGWRSASGQTEIELIELFRNGEPHPVELSLSTTIFRGEMLLTAIFRDLSERRRAECELLESNRQLQKLSAALENVREEERTRISREMHDELGQFLTGIRMELSWLGRRLSAKQDELADKVGDVKGQIDQTIAAVRRISSELRPLVLDDLGFAAAAAWYVDQFTSRTGLSVTLSLPESELPQGSPVATALFRLLQESLTNVARHAQASHVNIRLAHGDGYWRLSIQDDGRGFDPSRKRRSGIGLIGMRERVQILQGNLSIVTAPGGGTLVEASVPEGHKTEEQNAQDRGFAGR